MATCAAHLHRRRLLHISQADLILALWKLFPNQNTFSSIQFNFLYTASVATKVVSRVSTETMDLTLKPVTGAGRNLKQDQDHTFLLVDGWVKEDEEEGDRKRKGKI